MPWQEELSAAVRRKVHGNTGAQDEQLPFFPYFSWRVFFLLFCKKDGNRNGSDSQKELFPRHWPENLSEQKSAAVNIQFRPLKVRLRFRLCQKSVLKVQELPSSRSIFRNHFRRQCKDSRRNLP